MMGKIVGYMNERGQLITVADYDRHLDDPVWKWVIDQHWTPVAPLYAGEFVDRPDAASSEGEKK